MPFIVIFAVLFGLLLLYEKERIDEDLDHGLLDSARAYFEQIVVTRLWIAGHGGVYVEVKDDTKPNQFLVDPQREIHTVKGKTFTKINPAFASRQISEIAMTRGGYVFKITSLKPLNPLNAPDRWESSALSEFERGIKERYELSYADGRNNFRYIAPLFTEEGCLKCHIKQGYSVGDVRGALSISIPAESALALHKGQFNRAIIGYSSIGVVSVLSVFFVAWWLSAKIIEGIKQEMERQKLYTAILLAGAAAHELRQPMTIVIGTVGLLVDKVKNGEPIDEETAVVIDQCWRMDGIIKKMLNIEEFKTKKYVDDTEIFDINNSS